MIRFLLKFAVAVLECCKFICIIGSPLSLTFRIGGPGLGFPGGGGLHWVIIMVGYRSVVILVVLVFVLVTYSFQKGFNCIFR